MKFQGIILDLDGVICFTDQYHYQAWKQLADREGIPFDKTINNRLRGVSRMESLEIILERANRVYSPEEKEHLAREKNARYRELLQQMSPRDLSNQVFSTLEALRGQGLKLAIGSSSKNTPFILERLGLSNYFDAVSDGNNITHSKPDPEVFLKAAELLGLPPETCLVVEDALSGVQAAHAGGMKAAALRDASAAGAGEYNLKEISQLPDLLEEEEYIRPGELPKRGGSPRTGLVCEKEE